MTNHPNRCKTVLTTIPFSGFYESQWSYALDREEESFAEYFADEKQAEEGTPEHLRLDQSEVSEILYWVTEYPRAYLAVAQLYSECWNTLASEAVGFPLRLSFESMHSPREYNFTTDRIFCHIPVSVVRKLYSISRKEKHARLKKAIAERFTSRSGFISFYSNDISAWVEKPLADWDYNEVGTLLMAVVWDGSADFFDEMENAVYEGVTDSGLTSEFENAVDWAKFDEKVAEKRAEKAAAWEEEHPGEEAPYRCPNTSDLFDPKRK